MSTHDIDDPDLCLLALFATWPTVADVFLARRIMCFGCPIAPFHMVVDACQIYQLNEAEFRQYLRAAVSPPQS